jgi:hypothetical protein
MPRKKTKKITGDRTRARVVKEMSKPRMARSASIAELDMDPTRIPERPSLSMPGTVAKVTRPSKPSQPGNAKISLKAYPRDKQNLRIENALTDEHGEDVKLKKGAYVEVTVSADAKTPTP